MYSSLKIRLKIYIHNPVVIGFLLMLCCFDVLLISKKVLFIFLLEKIVFIFPLIPLGMFLICRYEESADKTIIMRRIYNRSQMLYIHDWIVYNIFGIIIVINSMVVDLFIVRRVDGHLLILCAVLFVFFNYINCLFGFMKCVLAIQPSFSVCIVIMLIVQYITKNRVFFPFTHYLGEIEKNIHHVNGFEKYTVEILGECVEFCSKEVLIKSNILVIVAYCVFLNLVGCILECRKNE